MSYFRNKSTNPISKSALLLLGIIALLTFLGSANAQSEATGPTASQAASLEHGFREMYNLDFAAAHKTFECWQELHPEDPLGPAASAAAYLFGEFERLHILELDLFTDNKKLETLDKMSPDPKIKAAFQSELAKADEMIKKVLADTPKDRNALFAKVLADGLRGDYAALVEHQKGPGLSYLKSSRSTAEKLIAIDPDYSDAYLALGIENYVLGLKSAPTRFMLRLTGAQTNKDKGIANLKVTAEKGRYLAPYARLLLAIAALRDQDKTTAKQLLGGLAHDFPHNRLYQTELARLQS
jgi:hypothetical protein